MWWLQQIRFMVRVIGYAGNRILEEGKRLDILLFGSGYQ